MSNGIATIKAFAYPQGVDNTQRNTIIRGTIQLSGAAGAIYPVGGFPLNWAQVSNTAVSASGAGSYEFINSTYTATNVDAVHGNTVKLPTEVDVWSAKNPPSGYTYVVDSTVGNLHIMVPSNGASGASGPMVEFGGTLVTAQLNDTIQFTAVFPRSV